MREETKEFTIPIRVNFYEKEKIKKRAEKVGKKVSPFIRDAALRFGNKRKAR